MNSGPKAVATASAELLELGAILGPALVHELVDEARLIRSLELSTHVEVRLHFHGGRASRAQWHRVRTADLGGAWESP